MGLICAAFQAVTFSSHHHHRASQSAAAAAATAATAATAAAHRRPTRTSQLPISHQLCTAIISHLHRIAANFRVRIRATLKPNFGSNSESL